MMAYVKKKSWNMFPRMYTARIISLIAVSNLETMHEPALWA